MGTPVAGDLVVASRREERVASGVSQKGSGRPDGVRRSMSLGAGRPVFGLRIRTRTICLASPGDVFLRTTLVSMAAAAKPPKVRCPPTPRWESGDGARCGRALDDRLVRRARSASAEAGMSEPAASTGGRLRSPPGTRGSLPGPLGCQRRPAPHVVLALPTLDRRNVDALAQAFTRPGAGAANACSTALIDSRSSARACTRDAFGSPRMHTSGRTGRWSRPDRRRAGPSGASVQRIWGQWTVEDHGPSRNGTFVNGIRLTSRARCATATIMLGGCRRSVSRICAAVGSTGSSGLPAQMPQ
jgi:hypothetical protein